MKTEEENNYLVDFLLEYDRKITIDELVSHLKKMDCVLEIDYLK